MLSLASTVQATTDHVACDLGGETAILHLESGIYFGLDAMATRIWQLLQTPRTLAELRDMLLVEYDVAPERLEQDLLAFVEKMEQAKLVAFRASEDA
jgi:hypothetical protein